MAGIKSLLTVTKLGSFRILSFIKKNWYFFIFAIVVIPTLIGSVQESIDTQNYALPFLQLGIFMANSDQVIYDDVQILKENPAELIGMEKPANGIWKNVIYFWHIFKIIWKELGLIWMISFPFIIFYKVIKYQGSKGFQSSTASNTTKAIVYGLLFIFFINMIMVVYNIVSGTVEYALPEDASFEQKTWLIILTTLPFHGLISLAQYLVTLF